MFLHSCLPSGLWGTHEWISNMFIISHPSLRTYLKFMAFMAARRWQPKFYFSYEHANGFTVSTGSQASYQKIMSRRFLITLLTSSRCIETFENAMCMYNRQCFGRGLKLRHWGLLGIPQLPCFSCFGLIQILHLSVAHRWVGDGWTWCNESYMEMMRWRWYGGNCRKKNLAPCNLHSSIYFVCLTAATTRAPSCLLHFQGLDCSGIRLRTRDIHHGMVPSANDENRFWRATISPKKIPNSTWYFIARQCLPSNHTNLLSSQSMFSLYMLGNLGSWLVDRFSRYLTLEPRNLKN